MKHTSPFVISEYTNPSGNIVFQLYARIDGKRFRKNFQTRAEAEAERQVQEMQLLQRETGIRVAATRLTDEQLHEAESAFCRVAGHAHPLSFYVEFALMNYREPVTQKPLAEVVAAFVAAKNHEREQDLLSKSPLERLKRDRKCLQRNFSGVTVADLTATKLMEYFEARGAAHKTFNNRRGIVSTFLKFAHQKDWIADNPLTKIPQRRVRRRRGCAATFTASQASELMAHVEKHHPIAVPFFALCLFAGIRPCLRNGEILRLQPKNVKLDANLIRIDGDVSKVREPRNVTIQPNLAAWLRAYPLSKFPIVPPNLQHIRMKVVQKYPLGHDVMRHYVEKRTMWSREVPSSEDGVSLSALCHSGASRIHPRYGDFQEAVGFCRGYFLPQAHHPRCCRFSAPRHSPPKAAVRPAAP